MRAFPSLLACKQVIKPSDVLIRQFSSDVWKIIWTIHRWCLFKLLPLESPRDTQLIGNVVSPKYEYDWQWTSNHDERLRTLYTLSSIAYLRLSSRIAE